MLTSGSSVSHYKILESIGAGGMGEIYRAMDTRLDRTVAIKALPAAFRGHADRLTRFEREAKILAALNHPNIAAIYGLEEMDGSLYLVLEFVQGESLAQRLSRGALEVRETLEIGEQIASAIEAAHDRGIVHRDLKPGNVMITPSRVVKVLDFGLAKGTEAEDGPVPGMSSAPTLARSATADGLVLGTAPYMSPEQTRGKAVDRRTDVWAFGCVLFECLTGRQTFAGDTVSDVIAHILERDPDWDALPASMPSRFRDVIRRCLTKEPAERPRDIGDLRRELHSILMEISSPGRAAASAKTDVPSLAVLYFENLAQDPESEYFCAGITEDILTDLSKIKGLRVASRNAVSRYRGASVDIPRVASELGVKTVLEGSVRRAGDRVRISAQLINASDGFHLWAERYDRTLADVFAVQEEIAHSIAEALRVTLSPKEVAALAHDKPQDARAYDLYLKGRERYGLYSKEGLGEALMLFKKAIEIDSQYALAWAGVADTYGQFVQWGHSSDVQGSIQLALEAARHSIELNPRLAEGYKALALALRISGDYQGSREALHKALEVNPRFVPVLINLGVAEYGSANIAATERYIRRALEVDPLEPFAITWLTFLLLETGRLDEAMAMAKRLKEVAPSGFYITAHYVLRAMVYAGRNDLDGIEQVLREGKDQAEENNLKAIEAYLLARKGRLEESKLLLRGLAAAVAGLGAGSVSLLAETAGLVGDVELAVPFVAAGIFRDLIQTMARIEPGLHPLVGRPPLLPRKWDTTLVWPLEAPMLPASVLPLFREVRIESGQPQMSELRSSSAAP